MTLIISRPLSSHSTQLYCLYAFFFTNITSPLLYIRAVQRHYSTFIDHFSPLVSKVFDFDHDMLAHFVATKHKEGWSVDECARAVEYIVHDWHLLRCVRFFGHFTRIYVELGENEEGEPVKNGKWTPTELGHLVGKAMRTREYAFMVDLLIKIVIGEGGHKTLLSHIKEYAFFSPLPFANKFLANVRGLIVLEEFQNFMELH
jgi:hypothetical protein